MSLTVNTQIRQGYHLGDPWNEIVTFVKECDDIGVHTIWSPEAWNYDALTPLAYLAAVTSRVRLGTSVMQIGARTPALIATSALTMAELTNDRFVLGLGVSGPQVMEGWHGVRYAEPFTRLREAIDIIRMVCAGERLEYHGRHHQLPLPESQGRALRTFLEPRSIPLYLATLGPRTLEYLGANADGWLGTTFTADHADTFLEPIRAGAESASRSMSEIDVQVAVPYYADEDVEAAMASAKQDFAFRAGAMGSQEVNFYNRSYARQGFGEVITAIQTRWREGDRSGAAALVPDELIESINLFGDRERLVSSLGALAAVGVTSVNVRPIAKSMDRRILAMADVVEAARSLTGSTSG